MRLSPKNNGFLYMALATLVSLQCRSLAVTHPAARLAQQRVPQICKQIESIRKLPFVTNVTVKTQSTSNFNAYVSAAIDQQFGDTGADDYMRGLLRLGLLEEAIDLEETYLALLEGQAAAHYDPSPGGKTYYILATNAAPKMLDLISAHELCHALQDQHFDLYELIEGDMDFLRDNADAALARQALVEGEATLIMSVWLMMNEMGLTDARSAYSIASISINAQTSMSLDDILALTKATEQTSGYSGMNMNVEALADAPRVIVQGLFSVYLQGAYMVDQVRKEGGWQAIDALYKNPPTSTEQVLHPHKLIGKRDIPTPIAFADMLPTVPEGWRLADEDVVGELGMRVYFELWDESQRRVQSARTVSTGWDGDRYAYLRHDDTQSGALLWRTIWDRPQDVREFLTTYQMTLRARFPDARIAHRERDDWNLLRYQCGPDRHITLRWKDLVVEVIDTDSAHPLPLN